ACLDAFAGSGVLGFEALSRGASEVTFVEQNRKTADRIKDNVKMLDANASTVYHQDVLSWLRSAQLKKPFDVVFLDPPFHSDLLAKSSAELVSSGCLAEDAIIYVEHAVAEEIELPESWRNIKKKQAGQVSYQLFELSVKE
ncbi:MAG: 16S rRNA (guanine(966)-N(2))-methyltransferase RsmD, partial [Gammaproteobacteria bacterium]|nr:16S rRNA (guanine(966)-N(2))-methyltransferase RsmD [Gammaproteobacteria bacterium]